MDAGGGEDRHAQPLGGLGRDHDQSLNADKRSECGEAEGRPAAPLDEDVQARSECQERVGEVPVVGRADDRAGGTRVAHRLLVRAEGRRGAELAGERRGPRRVAARREQRHAEAARGGGVAARDPAAAEEGEPSRSHEVRC